MRLPYERYAFITKAIENTTIRLNRYVHILKNVNISGRHHFEPIVGHICAVYRCAIDLYATWDTITIDIDSDNKILGCSILILRYRFEIRELMRSDEIELDRLRYNMITLFRKYPKIDLEELCAEAFKPSRVMYSIGLEPEEWL